MWILEQMRLPWGKQGAEQDTQVNEPTTLRRTEEQKRKKQNYETRASFQGREKRRAQLWGGEMIKVKVWKETHLARNLQLHKAKEKDQGNVFFLTVRERKLKNLVKREMLVMCLPASSFKPVQLLSVSRRGYHLSLEYQTRGK